MAHRLALIALIGLGASAICIGAAGAIDQKGFSEGWDGFSLFDGRPRCEAIPGAAATSREMDWDGSNRAGLNLLGQASYTPGSGDRLRASGDPQILAHLRGVHQPLWQAAMDDDVRHRKAPTRFEHAERLLKDRRLVGS